MDDLQLKHGAHENTKKKTSDMRQDGGAVGADARAAVPLALCQVPGPHSVL